jgi:arsenate reductase (glutaredoxin)
MPIDMNIQIFGTKKCFDTKKAERYFKERNVKFQLIDLKEKGLSKGEFNSVKQSVGGLNAMIDEKCKDKDILALIKYIADEDKEEKVLENQGIFKTPIVRNGKLATIGYQPDIWKGWN